MKLRAHNAEQRQLFINAHTEKILEKATLRNAIRHQRCLVSATGFFKYRQVTGWKTNSRHANSLMTQIHNSGDHAGRMSMILNFELHKMATFSTNGHEYT